LTVGSLAHEKLRYLKNRGDVVAAAHGERAVVSLSSSRDGGGARR